MAFIVDSKKRDGTQRKQSACVFTTQSTCIYVYGAHTNTQRTSVYATFIICNIFVGYALIRTFGTKGSVPLKRSQKNNNNQKNGNRNFRWIPPAVFSPFPYVICFILFPIFPLFSPTDTSFSFQIPFEYFSSSLIVNLLFVHQAAKKSSNWKESVNKIKKNFKHSFLILSFIHHPREAIFIHFDTFHTQNIGSSWIGV